MSKSPHHTNGHQAHHPTSHASHQPTLRPPAEPAAQPDDSDAAVALIRQKLAAIYGDEPDAKQEMAEAILPNTPHSKHQRFMQELHDSGKTESEIQAAWHQYYQSLDEHEKHEVWQEFYNKSALAKAPQSRLEPKYQYQPQPAVSDPQPTAAAYSPLQPETTVAAAAGTAAEAPRDPGRNPLYPSAPAAAIQHEPAADLAAPDVIRQNIRAKAGSRASSRAKHHIQSLLFGLGFGAMVLVVTLFGFFNEVFIAPFIQPSRQVSATPIIVGPEGAAVSGKNEVIIPKINVQIPLDFSAKTTDEKEFEAALDKGVAHYPTTALPGQVGNASFFGHSSNNIFNPGQYKFAFVLLNELVPGDTFYINYNGTSYAYQVYDKKVVEATAVEILNPVPDKAATAMLVTCDPPGTSLRRLAVWGEQVSPNPAGNGAASASQEAAAANQNLPGNGPTLWGRITKWISGQD